MLEGYVCVRRVRCRAAGWTPLACQPLCLPPTPQRHCPSLRRGVALLQTGVYVAGTELEGLHREVLVRAVRHLEQAGRAKLFKGAAGDDEGVKFFTAAAAG